VARRARNDAKNLTDGGLLLERLLRLVEQPHVVDGDGGLTCERFNQRDLIGREKSRLPAEQENCAVSASFAHKRNREHTAASVSLHVFAGIGKLCVQQRNNVRVM